MLKRVVTVILSIIVFCVTFSVASNSSDKKEIVYVYSRGCFACKMFEPIFERMKNAHSKETKFTKIDADSSFGRQFMIENRIHFVPCIIVIKNDYKFIADNNCIMNYKCFDNMYKDVMK